VSDTKHLKMAVDLVLSDKGKFAKLVTHRFGLEESTEALETVDKKEAVKAVLIP
jgi:threonine dehydrogenase-like Zn-dependent dehydrogenase